MKSPINTSGSLKFAENQIARFDPHFVQIATVMDNRDPAKSGKLKVWIENSQSDPTSKDSWITVSYMSPFAGRTEGTPGAESYSQFPKGYGFWAVPPDVGTNVAVFFANGNIHEGYWFACGYQDRMNTMVPGSATQKLPGSGYDMEVPITDYDRNTLQTQIDEKYVNIPLIAGLTKQNLLYDPQKGAANRSSTRQITSTVYGMSSPRGNSFIIDDGFTDEELNAQSWDDDPDGYQNTQLNNPVNDTRVGSRKNEGIVLRTRSGAQFLLSEDQGNVFLINRDGTARFEMTPDGQITVHSDKSITVRTDEDFNLNIARDLNVEVGRNLNLNVQQDSKLNLVGKLDAIVSDQVVINTGADLRLVASASIRTQSGSSTNILSAEDTNIESATNINLLGTSNVNIDSGEVTSITGNTSVNLTGAGTNLTVQGTVDSTAQINAPDFATPTVSMMNHIHLHADFTDAENHSNEMAPPVNGSGINRAKTATAAGKALKADDVPAQAPITQQHTTVQHINATSPVGQALSQDLSFPDTSEDSTEIKPYTTTYEGLQFYMPCTGTIRELGYWGKNVPTETGTTNRNGWIIQCKGEVCAPEAGLVTKMANGGIIITHPIGYKTVFYDLNVNINNKDNVQKGQIIGTSNGTFIMEIRISSSAIYGFSGTVDPGLFFSTVTSTGANCANKSLTIGKPSNLHPKPATSYSPDSSELVVITTVNGVGSVYSQRGSQHVPRKTNVPTGVAGTPDNFDPIDLSNIDKTAQDWVITPQDTQLLSEIKVFEGTKEYQEKLGYFRGGKFWPYKDSLGKLTIGFGHLIVAGDNFAGGITEEEADLLLQKDIVRTINAAKAIYVEYNMKTPYIVQLTLTEMVFQMGSGGVRAFKNTLAAMAAGNYAAAANGIRNSLWYRQTTNRAETMARRLEAAQ